MWPRRRKIAKKLEAALSDFSAHQRYLPGIEDPAARATLAMQMVASLRRLEYTETILYRPISAARADPASPLFDPERAAILHARAGRLDEAFWLVFLVTHFGKHGIHRWRRVQDIYSGLGSGVWNWDRVSADPAAFRSWLENNGNKIQGAFGNHRKYESLRTDTANGTAAVVESYVKWIGPTRSHASRVSDITRTGGNDPHTIFDCFYKSMNVHRFGRLAKFEFLALVGRLGLAPISPGSAYLQGATGALKGVRLLFSGDRNLHLGVGDLEDWLCDLDSVLNVGMQVMEDSLCNWHKNPTHFVHFRG